MIQGSKRSCVSCLHDKAFELALLSRKDSMLYEKKENEGELLLLFLLFLLCGALFAIRHFTASSKNSIKITVCGREQGIYDLSCDQIIRIGETNVCEIRDGQVRMIEADCPDQLCIKQGAFGADGGMIVCLPNRVVIEPASSTRTDAVS